MNRIKQVNAFKNDIERSRKYHGVDIGSVPLEEKMQCVSEDITAVSHYASEFLNFIGGGCNLEMPYILAGMRQAYKNLKKAALSHDELKGRYKTLCDAADRFLFSDVQLVSSKKEGSDNENSGK